MQSIYSLQSRVTSARRKLRYPQNHHSRRPNQSRPPKDLYLGNIDSKRDWGYAKEYVGGLWRMLQQDQPDDYVLATNETHTIKEFLEVSFGRLNLDWQDYVKFDERYLRPAEVDLLIGDYSRAKDRLGWEPRTRMKSLAELMVDADLGVIGAKGSCC